MNVSALFFSFLQKDKEAGVEKAKHFDFIVLGAGIAGLGAGEVLKRSNCKFLILEASDRVGGRIFTTEMKSFSDDSKKIFVDSGAQWLHGRQNELFKLAEKHGLIQAELSEEAEGDYVREDGVAFDPYFVKKVDFKFGQILEEAEKFAHKKNEAYPSSLEKFVEEHFNIYLESLESDNEREQAKQLLDWHRKFVSSYFQNRFETHVNAGRNINRFFKLERSLTFPFISSKSSTTPAFVSAIFQPKIGEIIPSMAKIVRRT